MKFKFIQDWGSYQNDTLVYVGYGKEEIKKDLQKYQDSATVISNLETVDFDGFRGLVITDRAKTLLVLSKWDGGWEYLEVLIHEIHHLVYMVMVKNKMMEDEMEAQAYQQEYMFRQIRQKLNKKLEILKNKKKAMAKAKKATKKVAAKKSGSKTPASKSMMMSGMGKKGC